MVVSNVAYSECCGISSPTGSNINTAEDEEHFAFSTVKLLAPCAQCCNSMISDFWNSMSCSAQNHTTDETTV